MNMLVEHGVDPATNRRLFSLDIATMDECPALEIPAEHFVCLLACDARGVPADDISRFVERVLRAGASYFVCWGPDCERVHDIIDELVTNENFGIPDETCIMTTWHEEEALSEALFFFLVASLPDPYYLDSTRAALAISIGSPAWANEIGAALDQPKAFLRRAAE